MADVCDCDSDCDCEPTRRDRLADAVKWKLRLGVPFDKIMEAHGYTPDLRYIKLDESHGFIGRGRDGYKDRGDESGRQ